LGADRVAVGFDLDVVEFTASSGTFALTIHVLGPDKILESPRNPTTPRTMCKGIRDLGTPHRIRCDAAR